MSNPQRIAVIWSPEARADLRAIDRDTALQILYCVDRYLTTRTGDVKKLKPPRTGFRLRCGDYRLFFQLKDENTVEITGVRNRKDAYRNRCRDASPLQPVRSTVFDSDRIAFSVTIDRI